MSKTMSNVDNFWLHMDSPINLMVISGFMEFDEPLEFEALKELLRRRLMCFDRFRQRVQRPISGVGTASWKTDEHFDIRSHARRIALTSPGDKNALKELVADLMSQPLDHTKPLWQVHLIDNYGRGCVVFFRVHHCIADGIALIHLLLSLTDNDPACPDTGRNPQGKTPLLSLDALSALDSVLDNIKNAASTTRKATRSLFQEIAGSISEPGRFVKRAREAAGYTLDAAMVLGKLAIMAPDPETVFKGKLGVRKCVAWTDPIDLENVKIVGKALEATINDVLIATVTGALRRYLRARKSRVNDVNLRVAVPVNVRKPGTELALGNEFSLVFLSLPVHIEDPVLRLKEIKRRMDELKHSPDAFVGFQLLNALGISPAKIAKRAAQLLANKATAVLTNVPGPREPLYLAGKKISNMMFWVPRTGGLGMGISILSYDSKVTVGLVTDERLVSDPETILEEFGEDFQILLELIKSGRVNGEPLVLHDRFKESLEEESIN